MNLVVAEESITSQNPALCGQIHFAASRATVAKPASVCLASYWLRKKRRSTVFFTRARIGLKSAAIASVESRITSYAH
jgi:hypothetical protein